MEGFGAPITNVGAMVINLLKETEKAFAEHHYDWDDVSFIACQDFSISIENFREVAAAANYETGYGAQIVARDLVIVMRDGHWFSRGEYDGSEWWQFNRRPRYPREHQNISCLTVNQANEQIGERVFVGWEKLSALNRREYAESRH